MQSAHKPNIIFILIDDMGWKDLGCYGSTFYETPNIDKLAKEGMLFTDAYAACPVCSPTRASIMSGRYPATVGVTDWIDLGNFHPCKGKLIQAPYFLNLWHYTVHTPIQAKDEDIKKCEAKKIKMGLNNTEEFVTDGDGTDLSIFLLN